MAELFVVGQITRAIGYTERNLWCKWSMQTGPSWCVLQGEREGRTFAATCAGCRSEFAEPLELHYAASSVQGWPKLHVELYAVNNAQKCFPAGYGCVHIPTKPGFYQLVINMWKVTPSTRWQKIKEHFGFGGIGISKSDLIYAGNERYKLSTRNAGKIIVDINVVFHGFRKFGVDYK